MGQKQKRAGYVRSAIFNGGGRGVGVLGLFFMESLLSRSLKHQFAEYLIAFSLATAGGIFFTLGLNRAVARDLKTHLPRNETDLAGIAIGKAQWVLLRVLPLVCLGMILIAGLLHRQSSLSAVGSMTGLTYVVLLSAGLGLQQILAETLRALDSTAMASVYAGPSGGPLFVLVSMLSVLLIRSVGEDLHSVLLTQMVISWVILLPGIFVLRQSLRAVFHAADKKSTVIRSMTPSRDNAWDYTTLMLTQLTFFACTQIDIWIAPFVIREDDLVWYLAPRRLVMLTSAPLQLLNLTIITRIPELLSLGRKNDLQKLLWKSATIGFVPAALILCLFLSFPAQLLSLIYGSQFDAGRDVLQILSGAQLINAWTGSCGIVLMMGGQQRSVLLVNFLVAFILVAAVFLIHPKNPFQLSVIAGAATAIQYLMLWGMTRAIMGLWTNAGPRPASARAT